MAKGGARGRSGPAPDPNALVREKAYDQGEWIELPKAGRQGAVPEWPLANECERESVLWERHWRLPQAVMWERNQQDIEVALYVRALVAAEDLDAKTPSRTLVKQLQEALGLSIPGLMRNRYGAGCGRVHGRAALDQRGPDLDDRWAAYQQAGS